MIYGSKVDYETSWKISLFQRSVEGHTIGIPGCIALLVLNLHLSIVNRIRWFQIIQRECLARQGLDENLCEKVGDDVSCHV